MTDEEVLAQFELGKFDFLVRNGPARARGETACQKKLCFTSIRVEPMARLMYELSLRDDCWFVKLDSKPRRNGMVRGRCFLTTPEAVGAVWRQYKGTDHVLTTVQDDDFTKLHRDPASRRS